MQEVCFQSCHYFSIEIGAKKKTMFQEIHWQLDFHTFKKSWIFSPGNFSWDSWVRLPHDTAISWRQSIKKQDVPLAASEGIDYRHCIKSWKPKLTETLWTLNGWISNWCILFVLNMAIFNPTFLGIWISFDMAGDMEWLMRLQNVYHVLTIPQSAGKQWKTTLGRYMFFSFWDPCETTM